MTIPYATRFPIRRTPRLVRERSRHRYEHPTLLKVIYWSSLDRAMRSVGHSMFHKAIARLPGSGLSTTRGYFARPIQRPVTQQGRLAISRRHA